MMLVPAYFKHCNNISFWLLISIAHSAFSCRRVWSTPVKTVSWRQRSEPLYRRRTTSPQMSQKPLTPHGQMTNQMKSLSLAVRVPSQLTTRTAKRQYPTKRKVLLANTPQFLRSLWPSSVYNPIVPLLPTESLHTKKTTTVTRKRSAKRTTWSPHLLVLVILSLKPIRGGASVPQQQKVPVPQSPSPPQRVKWRVLKTMVQQQLILNLW